MITPAGSAAAKGNSGGPRGGWVGLAAAALLLIGLAGFLVYQNRHHDERDASLNEPRVYTFARSDGSTTTCTAARPSVVEAARSAGIRIGVDSVIKAAQAGVIDSTSLARIRGETPGTDLFEVKKFALCEAYGNGGLTQRQYSDLLGSLIRAGSGSK